MSVGGAQRFNFRIKTFHKVIDKKYFRFLLITSFHASAKQQRSSIIINISAFFLCSFSFTLTTVLVVNILFIYQCSGVAFFKSYFKCGLDFQVLILQYL